MTESKSLKLLGYVHQIDGLAKLFAKVSELNAINEQVVSCLDAELRDYVKVANVIANRLILMTANSAIATNIRLLSPTLIQRFNKLPLLKNICYIHCKVSPTMQTYPIKNAQMAPMATLSAETSQVIVDIAMTITDTKLREVMLRIAGRKKDK